MLNKCFEICVEEIKRATGFVVGVYETIERMDALASDFLISLLKK